MAFTNGSKSSLKQIRRKADRARIGDPVTVRRLTLKPTGVGAVRIDHPRWTRRVGIVEHHLNAMVIIVGSLVGSVAEKTGRDAYRFDEPDPSCAQRVDYSRFAPSLFANRTCRYLSAHDLAW